MYDMNISDKVKDKDLIPLLLQEVLSGSPILQAN